MNAARAGQEITIKFKEDDNGTEREHSVGAENCTGTEMCIRDRHKGEQQQHNANAFKQASQSHHDLQHVLGLRKMCIRDRSCTSCTV